MYDNHEIFEHPHWLSFSLSLSISFSLSLSLRLSRCSFAVTSEATGVRSGQAESRAMAPSKRQNFGVTFLSTRNCHRLAQIYNGAPNNRTTEQQPKSKASSEATKSEKITWPKHAAASKLFHFWFLVRFSFGFFFFFCLFSTFDFSSFFFGGIIKMYRGAHNFWNLFHTQRGNCPVNCTRRRQNNHTNFILLLLLLVAVAVVAAVDVAVFAILRIINALTNAGILRRRHA